MGKKYANSRPTDVPNFKKGGKLAYCKKGNHLDFAYIFSDALKDAEGTSFAQKAQDVTKAFKGRIPADTTLSFDGIAHSGDQTGIQLDAYGRPINGEVKANGAKGKRKKGDNIPTQDNAVAFVEGKEAMLNPATFGKGGVPYGTDPIAFKTALRAYNSIIKENDEARAKSDAKESKGLPMAFLGAAGGMLGGVAADAAGGVSGGGINMDNLAGGITSGISGIGNIAQAAMSDGPYKGADIANATLGTIGDIAGNIPVAGKFIKMATGLGQMITGIVKAKKEKEAAYKEARAALPSADMDATAMLGNAIEGYKKGGKLPMYVNGTPWEDLFWLNQEHIDSQANQNFRGKPVRTPSNQPAPYYYDSGQYSNASTGNNAYLDDRLSRRQGQYFSNKFPEDSSKNRASVTETPDLSFSANQFSGVSDTEFQRPDFGANKDAPYYTPTPEMIGDTNYPSFTTKEGKQAAKNIDSYRDPKDPKTGASLTTGDKLQLASRAPEFAWNFANWLRKADVVRPELNPEMNKIKGIMANRNIDFQALLNEARAERNRGEGFINRATDNQAVRRANLLQIASNAGRGVGKIAKEGMMAQNQLRGEEASMLDALGRQTAAARVYAEDVNAKNKAAKNEFGKAAFANISDSLFDTGKAVNTREMNTLKMKLLNSLPGNYKFDPNFKKMIDGMSKEELIQFYSGNQGV